MSVSPALASPGDMCLEAAREAAAGAGVPAKLMIPLTLAESGRAGPDGLSPGPWTVNSRGKGHWFATKAEAIVFVRDDRAGP